MGMDTSAYRSPVIQHKLMYKIIHIYNDTAMGSLTISTEGEREIMRNVCL